MNMTHIASYRIIRKLGEGGMGEVFEAVHEAIERRVAIKVLHPEFAVKPEFTIRFFNEARAVNRVAHPGLVQVSDYGRMPNGTAYIVMEFLDGESLGSRLKRLGGPMAVAEVLCLARQVADALAAAHDKEIVHRDLKPDNIMIIPDPAVPGGERTKLLDFGIAKLTTTADQAHAKTGGSALMGTPTYMSPEQCRGAAGVDDKSDVYSFGVMLYVMLSGQLPFSGDGAGLIIAKHIYEEPPPLASIAAWLPSELVELVHALLVKDRQRRPTMRKVVAALDGMMGTNGDRAQHRVSDGRPITQRALGQGALLNPPSTLGGAAGQSRQTRSTRKRWLFSLLGASGLIVGVLGPYGWRASHLQPLQSAARPPIAVTASKSVSWSIRTEPSGAEVIRLTDGQMLGKTPWQNAQPASAGAVKLGLRLSGYHERNLSLSLSTDADMNETLDAMLDVEAAALVKLPSVSKRSSSKATAAGARAAAPGVPRTRSGSVPPPMKSNPTQRMLED